MYFVFFLVLLIHLCLSAIILFLSSLRIMHLRPNSFLYVLLVPLYGPLCALLFELYKNKGGKEVDLQVQRGRIESEIYRSLGFETDEDEDVISLEEAMIMNKSGTRRNLMIDLVRDNVVPLEEALSISSGDVRRRLMMDVLNSDTAAFYDLLEQARLNDDVEVVHYAATAMAELNKQYDLMLDRFARRHAEEPENADVLYQYCECLKRFLNLKMVRGKMLVLRRNDYISLLRELLRMEPFLEHYADLAEQEMIVEDYAAADKTITAIEEQWPGSEQAILLRIDYHVKRKEGHMVQEVIYRAMRDRVYYDAKTREQLNFWLGHSSGKEQKNPHTEYIRENAPVAQTAE